MSGPRFNLALVACPHCRRTWDPAEGPALVRLCTDVAAHFRDEHGAEERAVMLERIAIRLGAVG